MIYHCKFGEIGTMEGQFAEPSGVAVNAQNDIIVADTNNHRIQIFDKEGRFKLQFGECGKRDGQVPDLQAYCSIGGPATQYVALRLDLVLRFTLRICPSVCLFACPYICLSVRPTVCPPVRISVCRSICLIVARQIAGPGPWDV